MITVVLSQLKRDGWLRGSWSRFGKINWVSNIVESQSERSSCSTRSRGTSHPGPALQSALSTCREEGGRFFVTHDDKWQGGWRFKVYICCDVRLCVCNCVLIINGKTGNNLKTITKAKKQNLCISLVLLQLRWVWPIFFTSLVNYWAANK